MTLPRKKPTILEVARQAGVSSTTASDALNNKPGVAAETRQRILSAAKRLRYTPNMVARALRTERANTIGIVLPSMLHSVFTILFQGMETGAAEEGYGTLVSTTDETDAGESDALHFLANKRVDGLILTSPMIFAERQKVLLEKFPIPYVLAVRTHPDATITTVANNNRHAGRITVEYLASTGSESFLFLGLPDRMASSSARFEGWREGLMRHSLGVDPERELRVEQDVEAARGVVEEFFRAGRSADAIVCGSDIVAIGAMEAAKGLGLAVPEDVRITGFDDILMAAHLQTPLTTVRQPLFEIGKTATRLLLDKIRDPAASAKQVLCTSELVVREST